MTVATVAAACDECPCILLPGVTNDLKRYGEKSIYCAKREVGLLTAWFFGGINFVDNLKNSLRQFGAVMHLK